METAVEWLFKLSKERELDKFDLEQAKAMEKEQIMDAWWHGYADANDFPSKTTAEQYYNEKYNK